MPVSISTLEQVGASHRVNVQTEPIIAMDSMVLQSKHTSKGKGNCALFMSTNKKKNQPCISTNYLVQLIERVCTIQPSYVCDTMAKEGFFFIYLYVPLCTMYYYLFRYFQ